MQVIAKALGKLELSEIRKFSFKRNEISDDEKITDLIEKKKMSNCGKWIYVFCANNLSELLREFVNIRDDEKDNKGFARANKKVVKPNCIYVGSSNNLSKRMAEHFGAARFGKTKISASTYAIRFKEWLPEGETVTCFYFEVKTQSQSVLQALEDGIWNNLKPITGKKGGK